MTAGSIEAHEAIAYGNYHHMMIDMQYRDLFVTFTQYKEHRVQQIEELVHKDCKVQISFQILFLMIGRKGFHATPIDNGVKYHIVKGLGVIIGIIVELCTCFFILLLTVAKYNPLYAT